MQTIEVSFAMGSPEFSDLSLKHICCTQNSLAAWRMALENNVYTAASNVFGDFAVVISLKDGRTFMAVDRFSIQSMCYKIKDGHLTFSQQANELADGATEVDPQSIFDYLYFHVIPSPRTIYKDVYRLPPGHFALFDKGQLTVAPYWTPVFNEVVNPMFKDLRKEFKDSLKLAVESQIENDQPGCFLSGGTDSSTVAGLVATLSGKRTSAYSIGFDAAGYDEISYARLAARHFNLNHHVYYITPDDLVRSIPDVASRFDQPFGNSSVLPTYYCAKMAQENGDNKLLAGDGGDELFGGNSRYAKQALFDRYRYVPETLKNFLIKPILCYPASQLLTLSRKASSYVTQAAVPMPERLQIYNLVNRIGTENMLTPDFLSQINTEAPLDLQKSVWERHPKAKSLNQELAFDWRFTLSESDVPKVTGAARLTNMKIGFPLLDQRLVSFSEKLPGNYKLRGQQLRWFFKEALRDFLPHDILTKKKQGFGLPFGLWMTKHKNLNHLATDALESLSKRGIVRKDFIRTLLMQRLPEHPGYYGEMVWILMMLEHWLQAHVPKYRL